MIELAFGIQKLCRVCGFALLGIRAIPYRSSRHMACSLAFAKINTTIANMCDSQSKSQKWRSVAYRLLASTFIKAPRHWKKFANSPSCSLVLILQQIVFVELVLIETEVHIV